MDIPISNATAMDKELRKLITGDASFDFRCMIMISSVIDNKNHFSSKCQTLKIEPLKRYKRNRF